MRMERGSAISALSMGKREREGGCGGGGLGSGGGMMRGEVLKTERGRGEGGREWHGSFALVDEKKETGDWRVMSILP